jgi:hypothetical protein
MKYVGINFGINNCDFSVFTLGDSCWILYFIGGGGSGVAAAPKY